MLGKTTYLQSYLNCFEIKYAYSSQGEQGKEVILMGGKKTVGLVVLVVGIVILVLSLVADLIGIGGGGVFGYRQIAGTVVGAVATVVGLVLTLKR
jgi:hypothetical protein